MRASAERCRAVLAAARGRLALIAGSLTLMAGLLLWARLLVVTDMPRTAVAEPEVGGGRAARAEVGAAPDDGSDKSAAQPGTGADDDAQGAGFAQSDED